MGFTKEQAEEMQARVSQMAIRAATEGLKSVPIAISGDLKTGKMPMGPLLERAFNDDVVMGAALAVLHGHEQGIVLDIDPIGAPRMSHQDKWRTNPHHPDPKKRQRPCVTRYWDWKKKFVRLCADNNWELQAVLRVHFDVAMPDSWTKKKKAAMDGTPHQQKPDYDNLAKAIGDAFGVDDGFVWDARITKRWAYTGKITLWR